MVFQVVRAFGTIEPMTKSEGELRPHVSFSAEVQNIVLRSFDISMERGSETVTLNDLGISILQSEDANLMLARIFGEEVADINQRIQNEIVFLSSYSKTPLTKIPNKSSTAFKYTLRMARIIAQNRGAKEVGVKDLIKGVSLEGSAVASEIFKKYGITEKI